MNELTAARQGIISPRVSRVAEKEGVSPEALSKSIADGRAVILGSRKRPGLEPLGIGLGLSVKVNANIGTSQDLADPELEIAKLRAAEAAGTDTVMDLSSAGDIRRMRLAVLENSSVPVGTVPIYEAARRSAAERGSVLAMTARDILDAVRLHIEDGVDFITIHAGVTRDVLRALETSERTCGIVSRGGTILAEWMLHNDRENPLFEEFDQILDMAREHDVVLSLGDGLRPGALRDAGDAAQMEELLTLGRLARRSVEAGVQVIIEGPGHVPLDEIETQVALEKALCDGAPFYVLGPLVTDVAAGYDHIAAAIGGALAARAGADFLCYVTPKEHLGLPDPEDVREGVIASRIAAHAADIARRKDRFRSWDDEVSRLRAAQDWDALIPRLMDPELASEIRSQAPPSDISTCSMCGDLCVFKLHRSSKGGK